MLLPAVGDAVASQEDGGAVADQLCDLGAVLFADDEARAREDGQGPGQQLHALDAHGRQGELQHAHHHGEPWGDSGPPS